MPTFVQRLKAAFFGTPSVSSANIPIQIGPGGAVSQTGINRWVAGRQGTGTKVASAYGHPDALLSPTDAERLFTGEWVSVSSSWIDALKYDQMSQTQGSLYARLKRGKTYGPTLISPAEMGALASAPSKGHTINKIWRRARGGG